MARGRSSRGQRDDNFPSLAELLAPSFDPIQPARPLRYTVHVPHTSLWPEVDDARTYSPEGRYRDTRAFSGGTAPTRSVPQGPRRLPSTIGFDAPREALVCARRKNRREVIFALRKRKKGAGSSRRRNFWSDYKC